MAKYNSIPGGLNVAAGQVIARKDNDSGWEGKSLPTNIRLFTSSGTTTNGSITFNVSSAGFTDLTNGGCSFLVNDDDNTYGYEITSLNNTSVTVSIKRRQFTGISVLGINVLGSQSMTSVPNGTTVYASFIGV